MTLWSRPGTPIGDAFLHPADSLTDPSLSDALARYKRFVASRYRGLRGDELGSLPPGMTWVSPKIDGELWYLLMADGAPVLVAHNARILRGDVPLLREAATTFGARAAPGVVLAGELFAVGGAQRPRVGDVAYALRGTGDLKRLGFTAFDVLQGPGGAPPAEDWATRLDLLQKLLDGGKRVQAIKTEKAANPEEARAHYEAWVGSGKAEGMVLRTADGRIFKVKPIFTVDCAVIGEVERADADDQSRSLLLGLLRSDGLWQVVGSVGNLGTEENRRALHRRLAPLALPSRFRKASDSGALYRLLRPEVVVEVACTDAQPEEATGAAVRQWALRLDADEGWVPVAPVPGAGLLHPVLERVRDDKRADGPDVRVEQVLERCAVDLDVKAESVSLPPSRLVRREVYVKVTKGETAVRKFLVWKTGKEELDPSFPAWVVHFTDYSPGRKDPLKREVKVAPDEATATAIVEGMIIENVKKGWVRA